MKNGNSKLLFKYIKINFLVIFLPIVIASIVYSMVIQTNYEESYLDNMRYYANERMWRLETRAGDLKSIAEQISVGRSITPYRLQTEGYTRITAIRELTNYRLRSSCFEEMAICLNDSDIVYTESGTVDLEVFTERTFRAGGEFTKEDFQKLLYSQLFFDGTSENQYVISGNKKYRIMTYPLGLTTEESWYGTLIGIYEDDREELLSVAVTNEDRFSIVCTGDASVLYAYLPENAGEYSEAAEEIQELLAGVLNQRDDDMDYCHLHFRGTDYIGKIVYSDVTGWYCIDMVSKDTITKGLIIMQLPVLVLLALSLLLVVIFLSILLSVYNYKPIKGLYNLFEKEKRETVAGNGYDELQLLNNYIRDLLEAQNLMEEQIEINKQFSRKELIQKLLRSSIDPTLPQVKEQLKKLDIYLEQKYMAAILVKASDSQQKSFLRKQKQKGFYLTENIYKNYDAFLACVENEYEIIEFVENLESEFDLRIGIGNVYCDIYSLKYSLMEATIAVESSDEKIVWFSEELKDAEYFYKPLKSEEKLTQLLMRNESEQLSQVMNEVYLELLKISRGASDKVMSFLTSRIFSSLFEASGCLHENVPEKYLYYTNLETFIERLKEFCEDELKGRKEKKESQEDLRIRKIILFVDENYMRKEMSLTMLAQEFNLTEVYLSKIFKAATGKNFLTYVADKRMQLAAELLVETEDTIGVIVQKVGYLDAVNFTKKFTRCYKLSPGNYRKVMRK